MDDERNINRNSALNDLREGEGSEAAARAESVAAVAPVREPITHSGPAMSFEETSEFERRMQLEDPKTVEMPGGGTLQDVLQTQAEVDRQRIVETGERERAAILNSPTSSTHPDSVTSTTETGDVITSPVPSEPASAAKPTS